MIVDSPLEIINFIAIDLFCGGWNLNKYFNINLFKMIFMLLSWKGNYKYLWILMITCNLEINSIIYLWGNGSNTRVITQIIRHNYIIKKHLGYQRKGDYKV